MTKISRRLCDSLHMPSNKMTWQSQCVQVLRRRELSGLKSWNPSSPRSHVCASRVSLTRRQHLAAAAHYNEETLSQARTECVSLFWSGGCAHKKGRICIHLSRSRRDYARYKQNASLCVCMWRITHGFHLYLNLSRIKKSPSPVCVE